LIIIGAINKNQSSYDRLALKPFGMLLKVIALCQAALFSAEEILTHSDPDDSD
jgi:hypothetical protein